MSPGRSQCLRQDLVLQGRERGVECQAGDEARRVPVRIVVAQVQRDGIVGKAARETGIPGNLIRSQVQRAEIRADRSGERDLVGQAGKLGVGGNPVAAGVGIPVDIAAHRKAVGDRKRALGIEFAADTAGIVIDVAGVAEIQRQSAEFGADTAIQVDFDIVGRNVYPGRSHTGIDDAVGGFHVAVDDRLVGGLGRTPGDVVVGNADAEADIEFIVTGMRRRCPGCDEQAGGETNFDRFNGRLQRSGCATQQSDRQNREIDKRDFASGRRRPSNAAGCHKSATHYIPLDKVLIFEE